MNAQVCAVVPARNEAVAIGSVLRQLIRAGATHCVVVANGCTDNTVLAALGEANRFSRFWVIDIPTALGPDVPRAFGVYAALRAYPEVDWLLFVDGDWRGGFGPALADFLRAGQAAQSSVQFVRLDAALRTDQQLWAHTLCTTSPMHRGLQAALLPQLVHRSVFATISPWWIHHPGQWAALCLLSLSPAACRLYEGWDPRLMGNPGRSSAHHRKMEDTLLGDALEGCAVLLRHKPMRVWQGRQVDGYHNERRLDLLAHWQRHWFGGQSGRVWVTPLTQDFV